MLKPGLISSLANDRILAIAVVKLKNGEGALCFDGFSVSHSLRHCGHCVGISIDLSG
jgi:hypothetical protein